MRSVARGVLLGLLALVIGGALASRAGWLVLDVPRAVGQGPWLLSRATGITAFVALALDVIVGLLVSTRLADRVMSRGQAIDLHAWLSPLALVFVTAHAVVLVADGYIRFDALDVLVPFASPYRPVAVGLGVIAAYLALVVHASFALRARIGTRTWRRLHYVSFVAFVAASVHAIAAGSDAGRPLVLSIYAVPLAIVVVLMVIRTSMSWMGGKA